MRKSHRLLLLTTLLALPLSSQADPSPERGRYLLQIAGCNDCHTAGYLLQRLQAFRTGQAPDATVMTRLMKGYDDAQVEALAHWFADKEGR